MGKTRNRIYANSPYDLASEKDDAYRNGADAMYDGLKQDVTEPLFAELAEVRQKLQAEVTVRREAIKQLTTRSKELAKLHERLGSVCKLYDKQLAEAKEKLHPTQEELGLARNTQNEVLLENKKLKGVLLNLVEELEEWNFIAQRDENDEYGKTTAFYRAKKAVVK